MEEQRSINLILFCTPNNPTGKVISVQEWNWVFEALRPLIESDVPFYIGVDEAYAELKFSDSPFLIEYICQKLAANDTSADRESLNPGKLREHKFWLEVMRRLILFRSATKGLSAAGLRMSCMYVGDLALREELVKKSREVNELPAHLRLAYAAAISNFNARVLDGRLQFLKDFYKEQVFYVWERLNQLGIAVKDSSPEHHAEVVEGTFYVRADFSILFGHPVRGERKQFLKEAGFNITELSTDEEILYWFLASGYMMAPLSYFGGDPRKGILRITCTDGIKKLGEFLDDIEQILGTIKENLLMSPHIGMREYVQETPVEKIFASPVLGNYTANPKKVNTKLPLQIFTGYMKIFWENGLKRAEQCEEVRKQDLRNKIQPYFSQALQAILNPIFKFDPIILAEVALTLEESKHPELSKVICQVLRFIERKRPAIFSSYLMCCHGGRLISFLQEGMDDAQAEQLLEQHCVEHELRFNFSSKGRAEIRDLIIYLAFEYIISEFWIKAENSPFFKIICAIYANEPKSEVIEQVIKLKASIDYTHPRGDAKYTQLMATTLRAWYIADIQPENLLFFGIEARALVDSVFEKRVLVWAGETRIEMPTNFEPVALILCVFDERVGASLEESELNKALYEIPKLLEKYPNLYLIVDESYVERCYNGTENFRENSLAYLFLQNPSFKRERMVILRSTVSIFSSPEEKISVLTAFDPNILGRLVEANIEFEVHAPADLQFGYAYALSDWVKGTIMDSSYAKACARYIASVNKLELAKIQFKEEDIQGTELPQYVLEENNGWIMPMYFKLASSTQQQSPVTANHHPLYLKKSEIVALNLDGPEIPPLQGAQETTRVPQSPELEMASPLLTCGFTTGVRGAPKIALQPTKPFITLPPGFPYF